MKRVALLGCLLCVVAFVTSCVTSPFDSSWQNPDAQPLKVEGSKVAAIVMAENTSMRHAGEDALAAELTRRGATGIPLYTLIPESGPTNEDAVREELRKLGVQGVVVIRPVGSRTEVVSNATPSAYYGSPYYSGFYGGGGYYRYGWNAPYYNSVDIRTNVIINLEILVYSLDQNLLVWAGQTSTKNPSKVEKVIKDTAKKVTGELQYMGLIEQELSPN